MQWPSTRWRAYNSAPGATERQVRVCNACPELLAVVTFLGLGDVIVG